MRKSDDLFVWKHLFHLHSSAARIAQNSLHQNSYNSAGAVLERRILNYLLSERKRKRLICKQNVRVIPAVNASITPTGKRLRLNERDLQFVLI